MIKRGIYLLSIVLFSCSIANKGKTEKTVDKPENAEFFRFALDTLSNASYPNFHIDQAYQYQGLQLLFGVFEPVDGSFSSDESEQDYGFRLLVLDENKKLIFRSKGQFDSYHFDPEFYRSGNQSPILILAETGTEYSWGNQVFLLDEKGVKEIGDISLAVEDTEMENYVNIGTVTKIRQQDQHIIFSFEADSVISDPGGMNERKIAAKGYFYTYDRKEFKSSQE